MTDKNPVLVLGLGNDILADDAIGLHVVRALKDQLCPADRIDVEETVEMGLSLLDFIVGYKDLVIVDAVQTKGGFPGHIHEIGVDQVKAFPNLAPHFFGIGEALQLGRQLAMEVPERVRVFAIEVQDPFTLSKQMTPILEKTLPVAVERVLAFAREFARAHKTTA